MGNKQAAAPVLLRGVITEMTKSRVYYDAIFTEADKRAMENTAIVAALAGLNDIALNLSASSEFTDTVGDLVTFRLNGEEVRAWLWLSVFENGDEVEVVAERTEAGWIGYAIRRCSDGILSVHPHCERGSRALFKFFVKISMLFWSGCALVVTLMVASMMLYQGMHDRWIMFAETFLVSWGGIEVVAVFLAYRVSSRFKRQLPMANRIFATFGWKDPENVNLPRTSKKLRQPEDTWQMGVLIFRYSES
ncbi:TPA: hypothetical protein QDC20_002039 [Burkholderia aenigmatica]|uniref:putative type VI secretion system effector n=1 Tax=Burkholderia sp. AU45251 TaxID=3059204 RepID=UPI00264DCF85|nr:putative type VI secretion system effector [Burkholderia sp. AU45251]HDR9483961.1 hypothetical protein [Burkholderia aenigmatica]MDN7516220.1 putative type VI secretion system effector [Burkholderia sp. AU45251]HDR9514926.1 hypothetical protein [Burkholderia aenigmatica]HDR9592011.1 hypothetical protein [Burkholderia aenigmatica]HDR9601213.1 hypothetical protein [Burkholderia aenigmatica]